MQTKLEKRLRHLNIPAPSENLQERCLHTIPAASTTQSTRFQKSPRPFKLQKGIVASVLLFASVAGVAFLNTRPPSNGKSLSSGSTALAQVLEAVRRVQFVHAIGRHASININEKGWYSSDWLQGKAWFDAEKGLYTEWSDMEPPPPNLKLAKGTSVLSRMLLLANGDSYDRSATSSTLRVKSDPESWRRIRSNITTLLMGATKGEKGAELIGFNEYNEPKLLSSTESNWKGRAARHLLFEQPPSPEHALQGAPTVQAHLYIDPGTNLLIARQDFAVVDNNSPRLVAEYEFDYSRPDPTLFDSAPLKVGADVQEDKNPVH